MKIRLLENMTDIKSGEIVDAALNADKKVARFYDQNGYLLHATKFEILEEQPAPAKEISSIKQLTLGDIVAFIKFVKAEME